MFINFDSENVPFIDMGFGNDLRIRLDSEPVDIKYQRKAMEELRETPDIVSKGLEELRELLKEEPDLNIPTENDEFLIKFLRPCKFYAKSAFYKIRNYYKFRVKNQDLCSDLMPENVLHVFEQNLVILQPKRDQYGRRVIALNIGKKWKPSKCSIQDIFRALQICLEAAMTEPLTQVNGAVVIVDTDGLSFTHLMQFTPSLACKILEWGQDAIAIRLKGIHIVNNSYLFNTLFAVFKPYIREKLRHRIHFHNKDWKSLGKHINNNCLRKSYGGTMDVPEVPGNLVGELLQLYNKKFEKANSYGYKNKTNS